jgi:hypothetical protein
MFLQGNRKPWEEPPEVCNRFLPLVGEGPLLDGDGLVWFKDGGD